MGKNPSYQHGPNLQGVSWVEAQNFCEALNKKREGYRYRLPTEAEWEYAAPWEWVEDWLRRELLQPRPRIGPEGPQVQVNIEWRERAHGAELSAGSHVYHRGTL